MNIANKAENIEFRNDDFCCDATPLWNMLFISSYPGGFFKSNNNLNFIGRLTLIYYLSPLFWFFRTDLFLWQSLNIFRLIVVENIYVKYPTQASRSAPCLLCRAGNLSRNTAWSGLTIPFFVWRGNRNLKLFLLCLSISDTGIPATRPWGTGPYLTCYMSIIFLSGTFLDILSLTSFVKVLSALKKPYNPSLCWMVFCTFAMFSKAACLSFCRYAIIACPL